MVDSEGEDNWGSTQPQGHLYQTPSQSSETIMDVGAERLEESGEDKRETMSSGQDGSNVLMSSQHLWLPAHDLHKIKPTIILEWGGKEI